MEGSQADAFLSHLNPSKLIQIETGVDVDTLEQNIKNWFP